jgi:hypothetical protein
MTDLTTIKPRLTDRNFGVSSFKFNRWSAVLEGEQTIDDALRPDFWANLVEKIAGFDKANPKGRGDIIEVRNLETGLYAELIVRAIGQGFVKVDVLRAQEPDTAELAENSPLTTKWNPGKKLHQVIRASDRTVMHPGFQTKEDAVAWITDHMKQLAA